MRAASKTIAETGGQDWHQAPKGPHVALGRIDYPSEPHGILVYIKSSVSGDENQYVLDYKRRYPLFPHEATADQLFSEEQFEVYRALGFHATYRFLNMEDQVAMDTGPAVWSPDVSDPLVPIVLELLGLEMKKSVRPSRTGWG
jgi:hypothetical protein